MSKHEYAYNLLQSGKLLQSAQSSMLDGIVEDTFGSTPDFPSSSSSPDGNSDVSVSKTFQMKRRASLPDTETLYFSVIHFLFIYIYIIKYLRYEMTFLNTVV